jgi:hypothetical protein
MLGLARGRGHQWVVLAVNVHFPFSARPWALPVLCALYRTREVDTREGRAHKTPITLARQLVAALLHWFPGRRFVLLGDGHYASHELARFCRGHRRRLTLVSLFHPRAHLCQPPPPRRKGRVPLVRQDRRDLQRRAGRRAVCAQRSLLYPLRNELPQRLRRRVIRHAEVVVELIVGRLLGPEHPHRHARLP